jgi:ketosteroid isomerase-like protein
MSQDITRIREILEAHNRAIHDRDAEGVFSHFGRDAVAFDLAPPLRFVGEQVTDRESIRKWFATWDGPIDRTLHDLEIKVGGDVAFAHALERIRGQKTGGEKSDVWVRSTFGLVRTSDGWTIQHVHTSVPFHMDGSLRAAVDLKP